MTSNSTMLSRNAFLGDALKYLPSVIVPAISSVALLPITTRLFSPTSYGNYALAISALILLQMVTIAWLNSTILRFYTAAEVQSDVRHLTSTAFGLILLQSALIASICLVVVLFFRDKLEEELFWLFMLVPVQMFAVNLLGLPLAVLRARRQVRLYTTLNVIRYIVPPTAGILLSVIWNKSPVGMIAGTTAVLWLMILISYRVGFGANQPRFLFFQINWAKRLMEFGLPLIPAFLMIQVLEVSDRFIIAAYRGSIETGLYTASYTLTSYSLQLLGMLITATAAPLIYSIWEKQGREATEIFLAFVTRALILISLPAAVGISLLAQESILVFSTPDYIAGAKIIPWVASGVFLLGLQWMAQRGMMLANKTSRIMVIYLVVGLLNILANMILVPFYGFIAAGWTTFGAYVLLLILIALGSAPYLTWRLPTGSIIRSIISIVGMGYVISLMASLSFFSLVVGFVLKVLIGSVVYLALLFLTGEIKVQQLIKYSKAVLIR